MVGWIAVSGQSRDVGLRLATEATPDAVVVRLGGELDLAGTHRLAAALEATRDVAPGLPLVLDLSAVSFMDSSGVRALVEAGRLAQETGRRLALLRPSRPVVRVLDLVDLRRVFVEIEDLEPESLARAGAPDIGPT
jgi:anti-sigma B factor antagonist